MKSLSLASSPLALLSLLYPLPVFSSPTPTVSWTACPSSLPPGVDCGRVDVPLTYEGGNSTEAKGNDTVSLFLTRQNATRVDGPSQPLFFNPGGPGVSAAFVVAAGRFVANIGFSKAVQQEFDIIGLDPRGVGLSTPIKCNPDIFNERFPTLFLNQTGSTDINATMDFEALAEHNTRLGQSCANLTGPLISNLDSIHVTKDHELVRRALDGDKFNYFGLSYGSLIGSQYSELFPQTVGRMALDGLIDHSQSEVSTLLTEATTYETVLNKFFEWCDGNTTCALHEDEDDDINSKDIFRDLLSQADTSPLPAPGCNGTCQPNVTGEDIRYNVQELLQFVDLPFVPNWIDLGAALAEARDGNATALSTPLATSQTSPAMQGSPFSYLAIGCQDWLRRAGNVRDLTLRLEAVRPFAPLTAGASQTYYYQSTCLGWPAPVTNGQAPLNTRRGGSGYQPQILLSNSVYDPSCSIVWADGLRQQLPRAVSITRNGTGHTSHFLLGETRAAIDRYLATGQLPADGTVYQT